MGFHIGGDGVDVHGEPLIGFEEDVEVGEHVVYFDVVEDGQRIFVGSDAAEEGRFKS